MITALQYGKDFDIMSTTLIYQIETMATRRTPEEQLEALTKKQDQLAARIQKKKAEVTARNRRQDTRRKIIAGALALEHMERDGAFRETLQRLLAENVSRPEDRKLFDL